MVTARKLPYRHLSVRVPWHDTGWEGSVCADPLANGSCLRLGRIAEGRDDALEARLAGEPWAELADAGNQLPPCSAERAGFMSPHPRSVTKEHPYASWNDVYRKFGKATFELPAYSADCVPFRWMLRDEAAQIAEMYQLPYEAALEEAVDAEAGLRSPAWVQHDVNQRMLLNSFFSAIEKERSLFFVYAKESPVSVDPRRILIGVGRVLDVGQVAPYPQDSGGFGSVLWERVVRHSIRPAAVDGFLLPYHSLLALGEESGLDPEDYAVFVPDEATAEFSYASEHVSHDTALSLLLDLERTVAKIATVAPGSWDGAREWLSARVAEVWQARGPYPGLGAALTAFGIGEGALLAHAIQAQVSDSDDPWQLADRWLRAPSAAAEASGRVSAVMSRAWAGLDERRRALLRLLSRFDLTIDQATVFYQPTERDKAGLGLTDEDLLANPYRIYERSRLSPDRVGVKTIDHGVFPEDRIRAAHPLAPPSALEDAVDPRRVRALIVDVLEGSAEAGDTLRAQARVIQEIRDQPLQPACPVSLDLMAVCTEALPPEVETTAMADGSGAYQLARLGSARRAISRQITRRSGAAALKVSADWRHVIDQALGGTATPDDTEEELARREKSTALEVVATSRLSVLIGAAGTGKTTLLRALASLPEVRGGGLLLLAPTGKARVRMQEVIGNDAEAQAKTLAQLLVKSGRYDTENNRYQRSDLDRDNSARTVIVDECSMLTEEALDALLDGIEGFDRLILVGDPRQRCLSNPVRHQAA
ncbi:MAG TPA: AAA family ATPase [Streptosporangiaceae bacterium]|nr:AAA family ATPase [Streptosporangiaceae bacterium]